MKISKKCLKNISSATILLCLLVYLVNYIDKIPVYSSDVVRKCGEELGIERHSITRLNEWFRIANETRSGCKLPFYSDNNIPYVSDEELQLPIAYSISTYQTSSMLLKLLRAIYRPHNAYCIHVDGKSTQEFYNSIYDMATCFGPNVFLVPRSSSINVKWGYFSVLEANFLCIDLLLKYEAQIPWQYLINLNEKEYPLRTNWELVKALKALNGTNVIEAVLKRNFTERFPARNPDFHIQWIKGSFLVAINRKFAEFSRSNPKAKQIEDIFRAEHDRQKVPDELFFSTLNFNPQLGAPGSCILPYPNSRPTIGDVEHLARYVNWDGNRCKSKVMRNSICMLGMEDVRDLIKMPHLFVNKFHPNVEPDAYICMEYWMTEKVRRERQLHATEPKFDANVYADRHCTRFHI